MTSGSAQELHALEEPTYDGPSAAEVLARLRQMERFTHYALLAVTARDVERARDAARLAMGELASIADALEHATPAERLDAIAAENRRIGTVWRPAEPVAGDPLVDEAQADPVLVGVRDLLDFATATRLHQGPLPDGVLRAAVHVARQQPQHAEAIWCAFEGRWPEVRGAIVRAGALPDPAVT